MMKNHNKVNQRKKAALMLGFLERFLKYENLKVTFEHPHTQKEWCNLQRKTVQSKTGIWLLTPAATTEI